METFIAARPAWVEINLDHIAHNVKQLASVIGPKVQIMAVVKADAYGHGAVEVAKTAVDAGATRLAVAFVGEGIELRQAGVKEPILVFGYTVPDQFLALVQYNLTPTVFSFEAAQTFSCLAAEHGVILPLHIEVDTGMGRLGLLVEDAVEIIARIHSLAGLEIEGIFTHFAAADEKESSYTATQLHRFGTVLDDCRERGISFPIVHAANSAAAIAYPETRFDLVRLGISLYGCYPSPWFKSDTLRLLPALSLKSKVVAVKKVPPETPISYGYTFHTAKESLIATVTSGYADGYSRLFSNSGQVLVRGQRAPVVGRVCMDYFMIDVSHIPGVCLGDEVVLYGYQGEEQISVEEAAEIIGTFNYEVLCSVSKKVPRYYFREGRLTDARSL